MSGRGSADLNERLRKEGWYVGELTDDVAADILKSSAHSSTFIVYSSPETGKYTLSARFRVEGLPDDLIEHFNVGSTEEGKFQLSGRSYQGEDVIDAVKEYIGAADPPLIPALGKSFEAQISIPDEPPDYDRANRTLQPDIAPLPNITGVRVEDAKEAKAGSISPTTSFRVSSERTYNGRRADTRQRPHTHWHRYPEHNCCHPKNCWHCCWHRSSYWNGYREVHNRSWYNPRGTGPLRAIAIILFWILCGCCFGFCYGLYFCIVLCLFGCCYDDDD